MTAGLGGHTAAIAERLGTGFVLACDRDAESLQLSEGKHEQMGRPYPVLSRSVFDCLKALKATG